MLIINDDNGKKLPKKTQQEVNNFIDNLKNIPWFNPSDSLTKQEVDKQINFTLECFGIKASIEYKSLKISEDWASARASAWDSAWASARYSARYPALDSAWASAWASARASALDSAWASAEILIIENKDFKNKYPNGAFIQLFKLWEMGLYPCGVINGKFVIYSTKELK